MSQLNLLQYFFAERAQVHRTPFHRNPSTQAATGKIQELADHLRHPLSAGKNPMGGAARLLRRQFATLQHLRRHENCAKRVAEVVSDHSQEALPELGGALQLELVALA